MRKEICGIVGVVVGLLVGGCTTNAVPPVPPGVPIEPSGVLTPVAGYLCVAHGGRQMSTAWSSTVAGAEGAALALCAKQSRQCQIQGCETLEPMMAVSSNAWYTCYVTLESEERVWSATSHVRMDAMGLAYRRCVADMGMKACLPSYCRIW
ncbi:MAG: hypothetical protein A3J38_02565 [Gammaproteobacteria bacterium RIFCSPHIGHO2_12_FULL_45_9]|nr:MAG: hypothetical protein A3J38_02565 [Gammaproteobacteria bacterium RIFCSPHIGHO2_12_FULL_45_9]